MSYLKYFLINWPGEVYLAYVENLPITFGIVSSCPGEWMQNVGSEHKTPGNVMPIFMKGKRNLEIKCQSVYFSFLEKYCNRQPKKLILIS